jgi:hypothetical protein
VEDAERLVHEIALPDAVARLIGVYAVAGPCRLEAEAHVDDVDDVGVRGDPLEATQNARRGQNAIRIGRLDPPDACARRNTGYTELVVDRPR